QRVRLLRQALGDTSQRPRYLRSVRGQGYQLCAPVQALATAAPVAPAHRHRRGWIAGIAAVGMLAAALAIWQGRARQEATASPLLQRADYYAGIGQRENNERAIALYRQRLQEAPDDVRAQL